MTTIEELVQVFDGLAPAAGNRWAVHEIFPGRLFISRDGFGRHSLFLAGEKSSFGRVPRFAGVAYSDSITVMPSGASLRALRLTTGSMSFGDRVMAHIAYELLRRLATDASCSNVDLLNEVRWVLELLGGRELLMSDERQRGLVGECVFLRKLVLRAQASGIPAAHALGCWHGYEHGKRDFSGGGIAVEAKFTSTLTRQHFIHGLAQLEPQPQEEVFIFSLGSKVDPGAPKKLPDFIGDVMVLLTTREGRPDEELRAQFSECLAKVGYLADAEQVYRAGPGFMHFHLLPKLYRESELDRVRLSSFKEDRLPSMVLDVSHTLEVRSEPLDDVQEMAILTRLLSGA